MTAKVRKPTFHEEQDCWRTVIYSEEIGTWVEVIIFPGEDDWKINYENKDPSENIHSCKELEEAFEWVCAYHKQSVRNTFIVG